jgi:ribonuclease-3
MTAKNAHLECLKKFQDRAGVVFHDTSFLETAFTHRSYLNEARPGNRAHNERLEFLGDAVLELAVTDHLYSKYPDSNEGDMTAYRAALVNAVMLGGIAESLGVNECLLLSRGEAKDTGRARSTILANAFEAIIGAVYLDQGFDAARSFVERHVLPHIAEVIAKGTFRDAKSEYQEFAQAKYGLTPKYETVKAEGPDHARTFTVSVSLGDVVTAEGEGQSKQEAEQDAARRALDAKDAEQ